MKTLTGIVIVEMIVVAVVVCWILFEFSDKDDFSQKEENGIVASTDETVTPAPTETPTPTTSPTQISKPTEEPEAEVVGYAPFWGIWCYGVKNSDEAYNYARTLSNNGFDGMVYLTTDWSNLNSEPYYVVTAGIYSSESEAKSMLALVQSYCADAYVKYSGEYIG